MVIVTDFFIQGFCEVNLYRVDVSDARLFTSIPFFCPVKRFAVLGDRQCFGAVSDSQIHIYIMKQL